jgi:hypothetical protein
MHMLLYNSVVCPVFGDMAMFDGLLTGHFVSYGISSLGDPRRASASLSCFLTVFIGSKIGIGRAASWLMHLSFLS